MDDSAERGRGAVPVIGAVAGEAACAEGTHERVHPPWRRVVVKLSGEAFSGDEPLGISPEVVYRIASEIVSVVRDGVEVAAMRPRYLNRDQVRADVVAKERSIVEQITRDEGKPEQAIPKIVEGRLGAFFKDVTLVEQPFVKDQKKTVKQMLSEQGVTAQGFALFEVGKAG